jgi:hypothetical protein
MIKQIWQWLKGTFFPALPILGPLSRCTVRHHAVSIKEFLVTLCFSTATFWLTALFLRAFARYKSESAPALLYQTVSAGQLFIFSVGFLGPILIAAADDPPRARVFPGRTSHFLVLIILAAIAAGFYSLHLTGRGEASAQLIDSEFLIRASLYIAIFSVVLRYLTTVYRRSTLEFDVEKELKAPVEDFAQQFTGRHEERAA